MQGTATVDEADLKANAERYFEESEKLPATKKMHPPKPLQGMFNWYYTRIYIRVRPEARCSSGRTETSTNEPVIHDAHVEEVRSGASRSRPRTTVRPPEARPPGIAGWSSWRATTPAC